MLEIFWNNFFNKKKQGELKYLKDCPLFSPLSNKEIYFLQKILHKRIYTHGEIVFKPSSGQGMYILLKGQVNILYGSPEAQEDPALVSSLKEGDFFGELSLLHKDSYQNMFAQAAANCQLLAFYEPDLLFVLENRPATGIKILKQLCFVMGQRLKKAEQKILQTHLRK